MPLYEYECAKGHRFELIRKFSDPPVTRCIKCKAKVRKLLSSSAIAFKGSGWYVTDHGRKGSSAPSGESGSDSGSSSKSKSDADGSSSEKKPEKKPEKKT